MFPSLSAYYHHSKKYSNVLAELEFEYAFAKSDRKKFDLLKKFSDQYFMPIELWVLVKDLIPKLKLPSNTLQDRAFFSFCNDPRVFENEQAERYILQQENRGTHPISLNFPHSGFEQDLMKYEMDAIEPLSKSQKEKNEKLKMLFWEIKAKQKNVEEWFNALTEAENIIFLKINVEHRLSFHLWDKVLWKLYIKYLERYDSFEMLRVYSKYCRFFLDDAEMIEEYKLKLKKHGYTRVPWKNRYKNEKPSTIPIYLPLYESPAKVDEDDESENEEDDYFLETVNLKFKLQDWSLPSPVIRYMTSTANHSILRKLHHSCKYFFIKKPKLLCYKFWCIDKYSQHVLHNKDSIQCLTKLFLPFHLKNLYVTTSFKMFNSNPFMLSRIIKNVVVECTAKFVEIYFQTLTPKELKFLIGHGDVEHLEMNLTTIEDEKENNMLLEDLFKMVPKIKSFE